MGDDKVTMADHHKLVKEFYCPDCEERERCWECMKCGESFCGECIDNHMENCSELGEDK